MHLMKQYLRGLLVLAALTVASLSASPSWADKKPADPVWGPLLSPAALAFFAAKQDLLILDIRGKAGKKGPAFYDLGHVPGAVSAPYGRWRGPKTNPGQPLDDAAVTALLRSVGATPGRATVVVSQGGNATDFGAAARVYWTLKSAGVQKIAILNGGTLGWLGSGRALSTEPVAPTPSAIEVALDPRWTASRADIVAATAKDAVAKLIDARPLAFFTGKVKHKAAKKPGTLNNATQLTHDVWFPRGASHMGSAKTVKAMMLAHGYDPAKAKGAVSFCNTGHWAATNWFALSEMAGVEGVRMYPESMVGWTHADLPVTKGTP